MPKSRQPDVVWKETRRKVWSRDKHKCQSPLMAPLCQGKPHIALNKCHIDHIKSGLLGTNRIKDLRTLCRPCHVLRSDMRHRGMISKALRDGIIPIDWWNYVWDD